MTAEGLLQFAQLMEQTYDAAVGHAQDLFDLAMDDLRARQESLKLQERVNDRIQSLTKSIENAMKSIQYSALNVALPPTNEKEIGAFEAYFLGEFAAYIDDFVEAVPVVYGNPSPMLTASDIAIRLVEIDRGGFA
jgi:hypothetical protein